MLYVYKKKKTLQLYWQQWEACVPSPELLWWSVELRQGPLFPACNRGVGQEMALCLLWAQKSMWSNSKQQKRGAFRIGQHFMGNHTRLWTFYIIYDILRGTFCRHICIAGTHNFLKGYFRRAGDYKTLVAKSLNKICFDCKHNPHVTKRAIKQQESTVIKREDLCF